MLGTWLHTQRLAKKDGTLAHDKSAKLQDLVDSGHLCWETDEDFMDQLKEYVHLYGDCKFNPCPDRYKGNTVCAIILIPFIVNVVHLLASMQASIHILYFTVICLMCYVC